MTKWTAALYMAALSLLLVGSGEIPAAAATSVYLTESGGLCAVSIPGSGSIETALSALADPPATGPGGVNLSSAIPYGTRLLSVQTKDEMTAVDFSAEIIGAGLDEARAEAIYAQVNYTLEINGVSGSVRILAGGKDLYLYLPPTNPVSPNPQGRPQVVLAEGTLSGRLISLSPGHGLKWGGSSWTTDRPVYCAPLNQEDYHNLEMGIYLETHLLEAGATLKTNRCTDKSFGNHWSGDPWWHMGPSYWLEYKGYPCSVYANATGDCVLGSGASEASDNIRSRGLMANYDDVDIHVAIHTNGLTGYCVGTSCPTGTETYYDNSVGHAAWGAISQSLATFINNGVVNTIRSEYPDSSWRNRGVKDFAGGNYETRVPECAAALLELAFHDTCDKDAVYLRDNFYRSLAMWGMYKGICDYFGAATTWGMYSGEIVSHTIPATMAPGEVRQVTVTLKNHGVLWTGTRAFRLGAVGESDPFSALTRIELSDSEVPPGAATTFSFALTAPATPGNYRTEWQMVRDGFLWFGPVVGQDIQVEAVDTTPPAIVSVDVTPAMVAVGDNLLVEVETTDESGITTVTADGTPLTHVGGDIWSGTVNSAGEWGQQAVDIQVTDGAGNKETGAGPYTVARILWAAPHTLQQDPLMPAAAGTYLFTAWGRVGTTDTDGFILDDAQGASMRVTSPGHGMTPGDLAAARGIWDWDGQPPTLTCRPEHVWKLN